MHEIENEPVASRGRIELRAAAPESPHHRCGRDRLRLAPPAMRALAEAMPTLVEQCYAVPAGETITLKLTFHRGAERTRPHGTLVLQPQRGKVRPSRIELQGTEDEIEVQYTAPDETIRVSVRAFLPGFLRGKLHLHLE